MTHVYDGFGRLVSTVTSLGGFSRAVAHKYDRDRRDVELTFPDGQKFWAGRDGLGRRGGAYYGALGDEWVGLTVFYYNWTSYRHYFGRRWGSASSYEHD